MLCCVSFALFGSCWRFVLDFFLLSPKASPTCCMSTRHDASVSVFVIQPKYNFELSPAWWRGYGLDCHQLEMTNMSKDTLYVHTREKSPGVYEALKTCSKSSIEGSTPPSYRNSYCRLHTLLVVFSSACYNRPL